MYVIDGDLVFEDCGVLSTYFKRVPGREQTVTSSEVAQPHPPAGTARPGASG
jgi:hypothetical protein